MSRIVAWWIYPTSSASLMLQKFPNSRWDKWTSRIIVTVCMCVVCVYVRVCMYVQAFQNFLFWILCLEIVCCKDPKISLPGREVEHKTPRAYFRGFTAALYTHCVPMMPLSRVFVFGTFHVTFPQGRVLTLQSPFGSFESCWRSSWGNLDFQRLCLPTGTPW